jgi:hypothetical protein
MNVIYVVTTLGVLGAALSAIGALLAQRRFQVQRLTSKPYEINLTQPTSLKVVSAVKSARSEALAKLIEALDDVDKASIRLDDMLVIKRNNETMVTILTQDQISELVKRPSLMQDLEDLQNWLSRSNKPDVGARTAKREQAVG